MQLTLAGCHQRPQLLLSGGYTLLVSWSSISALLDTHDSQVMHNSHAAVDNGRENSYNAEVSAFSACNVPSKLYSEFLNSGLGQCRDYGNLDNGYRIIDGTTEGSTVAFGCNDGYDLLGNRQLTCASSGLWIGAWPQCVRCEYEA